MPVDPRIQAALDAPHGAGMSFRGSIKPKRGYAAAPGSGPAGETCLSCRHKGGVKGNEYASQCSIAPRGNFGVAIYISSKSPACLKWQDRS